MSNEYTEAAAEFIYDEVVELDMETMQDELRSYFGYDVFKGATLEQVQDMLCLERLEQSADRYSYRCED